MWFSNIQDRKLMCPFPHSEGSLRYNSLGVCVSEKCHYINNWFYWYWLFIILMYAMDMRRVNDNLYNQSIIFIESLIIQRVDTLWAGVLEVARKILVCSHWNGLRQFATTSLSLQMRKLTCTKLKWLAGSHRLAGGRIMPSTPDSVGSSWPPFCIGLQCLPASFSTPGSHK